MENQSSACLGKRTALRLFELANVAAKRGLPKAECFGSPPEAPPIGSCYGISEVLKIDG